MRSACWGGSKPTVVTKVNIDTVAAATEEDHHTSTWSLGAILHIPKSSIHKILTEHFGLWCVSSTWVPHHLTSEQMEWHVNACNENLQWITQDRIFLLRVITCDESWVHYYDPLTKQESETWQRLLNRRPKRSANKSPQERWWSWSSSMPYAWSIGTIVICRWWRKREDPSPKSTMYRC